MDFVLELRSRGLKSTPQRVLILSEVFKAGHIDIDALFGCVNKSFAVPLGTLYRSITELSRAGIIRLVSSNNLKTHYEIAKEKHSHFICNHCGSITDFDYVAPLSKITQSFSDGKIETIETTVYGVCKRCKQH